MLTVIEEAPSQDLTTLDTAKAELGVTGSASDVEITRLIRQASAACARLCNRPHFGRELVEQAEGISCTRISGIILERDIEPSIVSVTSGGTVLAADEYAVDRGMLRRVSSGTWSYWAWAPSVVVRYYAGFELFGTLPDDIERACLSTIRTWWHARGRDPGIRQISTEGVGLIAYGTAGVAGAVSAEAEALLAPWRRFGAF